MFDGVVIHLQLSHLIFRAFCERAIRVNSVKITTKINRLVELPFFCVSQTAVCFKGQNYAEEVVLFVGPSTGEEF